MSWLLKSLQSDVPDSPTSSPDNSPTNRNAGVKEDLSVLGETIGRQLRGVAAFLAPPPSSPPSVTAAEREQQDQEKEEEQEQPSDKLVGIRNDLAEIGGSFKSGLSLLSSNKAVTEISRFASGFLQLPSQDDHGQNDDDDDDDDDDDGVPGITEDVVAFVKEISNRPEFWTDFPLSLHNDFKMSEAQREHAENIEHLVPSFEDLKVNLHSHMGDERFWMIYFILLLPRLNEHDFELLSTPEVVKTRDALLQKLQNNNNAQVANSSLDASEESSEVSETKRENVSSEEKVSEIVNAAEGLEITDEENAGQWLEEADISSGSCVSVKKNLEDEEDVSFSDLEDDDNYLSNKVSVPKSKQDIKASSPSGSNDWVQLNKSPETRGGLQKAGQSNSRDKESEGEESNDWLTDDDFVDVASGT
ncbi:uncharacterized protein LOC110410808 isoform X1 [Herrania umbratica]|uniref:Uncharacterized protein LOC110410808 isoform X1 n=1 Tax=Herrania umbratica TaxID=108875 RepID=A0A6J0ZQ18_9ROSI|nr:uncharacterized protein LOC110410808 isoform X1 [Herrania umbratica]